MLTLLVCLVALVALVLASGLFRWSIGVLPRGERKARIQQSPYWKDGKLENETPTTLFVGEGGWKKMARRERSSRRRSAAGEIPVVHTDLKALPAEGDYYVWFGHSSFLLRLSGRTILVDPVFYKGSPVSFINRPFPGTDVYKPSDLPERIDYLVLSHDHWDHLDAKTVRELRRRVGKAVCPLGVGQNLQLWGYTSDQLIELDCNEVAQDADLRFHCLPTRHFSGRWLRGMQTQRASWLIDSPSRRVFYSGDGGYSERFARYGAAYPDIDLAILENGQYSEAWPQIHTLPAELSLEVEALHPRRFVTVHHSKFALADHSWDEPRRNEQAAAAQSGVPLVVAQIGQVVWLDGVSTDE